MFVVVCGALLLWSKNVFAAGGASAPAATRSDDRPTVIVVQGAEGEAEYAADFAKAADQWVDAAKRANARVTLIGRDPRPVASAPAATSAPATAPAGSDKARLTDAIAAAIPETTAPLWIVFIGHGTYDGKEAKFNLRDADISDTELATLLRPCVRPLAFIDCSSCSAPFLNKLSAPGNKNRVIITATRTGQEVNYSRFAGAMAAAIADPAMAADLDKDGQVSLLEAFLAASHSVAEFYKSNSRLATEHAILDDNGDALGISADFFDGIRAAKPARNGAPLDGARAHQWVLLKSAAELALTPGQREQRNQLELQIESLRGRKPNMNAGDYYAQLDALLLKLAHVYENK